MRIPFGTSAYKLRSLPASAQSMVNCYLEAAPPEAKSLALVVAAYGVKAFTTVGTGPLRGAIEVRGKFYVVSGTTLYSVSAGGTATSLGTIPGTGICILAGDETHVVVVTDGNGWYWDASDDVTQITTNWPGARWVGNLNGYFLLVDDDTGKFYITANRDPSSIDALDFASAEAYPDDLVTAIIDHEVAILFGTESGEAWYDSGNSDFALSRDQQGFFEKGCWCLRGPAKVDNTVFFPGHDGIVYRLNGYTPERISTTAVEQAMESAKDRDFIGMAWNENGHWFYSLHCADFAFVYDVSTQLWHERASYRNVPWRRSFTVQAFGEWIVGDSTSNKLGILDPDTFTEWGDVLRASCTAPPIADDNKRITHSRLELVFEQGVGLSTGQGSDPQVMLRYSDDGGRTWSAEKWRSLGKMGEFRRRAIWNRLGQARDRVYEYAISDPVRRTLILATAEAQSDGY